MAPPPNTAEIAPTPKPPAAAGPTRVVQPIPVTPSAHAPVQAATRPCFEYIGQTALIVIGPATGNRYHFAERGRCLAVDPRDRASLGLVPQLALVPSC